MSLNPSQPAAPFLEHGQHLKPFHRSVSWAAIVAGVSSALALQVLLMMLGAGLGFAIYNPLTDSNPIAELGAGAVIIQGLSAVLSLWAGGWVAGRFTPTDVRATGWLHGFSVWCAATVAGVLLVSFGAGWVMGDLAKLVGGGLAIAGRPAAAVAGRLAEGAQDALKQSGDTLASFAEEALASRPAEGGDAGTVRARREITLAIGRLFNPHQEANLADNRAAVVKVLVDDGRMSQADAERMVTEWTQTYERLKEDLAAAKDAAEATAREAADKAAVALAALSLAAFVGFLLGAIAASCGGTHGARCATRCETRARPEAA